ncbi:MAG: aspartate kinase [Kiritimatiellae bacterium]|nr:aspartate kinase [Kiritimatiellia bacterium]MBR4611716.1 aspartate kinase [Kiritimatiellia bacterium]
MKVCKFGGSSVADAAQISKVCDIMMSDRDRRVVVVSAPGKRSKGDTKVTDMLISCAERALEDFDVSRELEAISQRFAAIIADLGLEASLADDIAADLASRLAYDKSDKGAFLDLMKAAGEDNSAKVVAAALRARGASAIYLNPAKAGMLLEGPSGDAVLCDVSYGFLHDSIERAMWRPDNPIVVFPGFFGVNRDGKVATFPRGGSDITGAILAAAMKAECYENFTDVDTVYAVDPRVVPDVAHGIREMTYREMRELAYAGFGVFHDEAVMPAFRAGIPINIRNTNHPDLPGTWILPSRRVDECRVVGIASDSDFVHVYVEKYMMNREVGFGRKLLQIFEEEQVSFEHMPTGIDNITIILRGSKFPPEVQGRVLQRIKKELAPDQLVCERDHALIMVVGEGMQHTVGTAARATKALAEAGVNIELINQDASEISIMFGVRESERARAVNVLYHAFFCNGAI